MIEVYFPYFKVPTKVDFLIYRIGNECKWSHGGYWTDLGLFGLYPEDIKIFEIEE